MAPRPVSLAQRRDPRPPRQAGQEHRQDRRRPRAAHLGLLRHARRAHPPRRPARTGRMTWPGSAAGREAAPLLPPAGGRLLPARRRGRRSDWPRPASREPAPCPPAGRTPGTSEGMNAARGAARPDHRPWGRHNLICVNPPRELPFPAGPRLSASGHPRQGRLRRR